MKASLVLALALLLTSNFAMADGGKSKGSETPRANTEVPHASSDSSVKGPREIPRASSDSGVKTPEASKVKSDASVKGPREIPRASSDSGSKSMEIPRAKSSNG